MSRQSKSGRKTAMSSGKQLDLRSYAYVIEMAMIGAAVTFYAAAHWMVVDPARTKVYLIAAVLAAIAKVRVPGKTGTVSLSFLFILLSNMELSLGETLIIGFAGAIVQSYWRKQERPSFLQLLFNLGNIALSIAAARVVYQWNGLASVYGGSLYCVIAATATYFLVNHFSVAIIIAFSEERDLAEVWSEWRMLTLPYNIVGAAMMVLLHYLNQRYGWACAVVVVPVLLFLYRSYRQYIGIMKRATRRAAAMSEARERALAART